MEYIIAVASALVVEVNKPVHVDAAVRCLEVTEAAGMVTQVTLVSATGHVAAV